MISVKKSSLCKVSGVSNTINVSVISYNERVIYPSLSSSYFLNTSVILFKLIQLCTKRSKLIAPFRPLSYVLNNVSTKPGLSRYPKATKAFVYSVKLILPLLSASNRSKSDRQAARNPHRPQNSSNPIAPDRSLSNMRIIILTVWGSKDDQSPFTRAAPSSFSVSCPVPVRLLIQTICGAAREEEYHLCLQL
jgi:hypothetical protein